MNNYSNVILSSTLFGSIYLFSISYRIFYHRSIKKIHRLDALDAINASIMVYSGFFIVNTGIKALEIFNK